MKRRFRWRCSGGMIAPEPRYLFFGAYWTRRVDLQYRDPQVLFDLYVCIVPMLPICLRFRREKR